MPEGAERGGSDLAAGQSGQALTHVLGITSGAVHIGSLDRLITRRNSF